MCTAATYKTKDFYFGRTLDYEFSYREEITVTPRNYPFSMRNTDPMTTHFAIIGMAYVVDNYPLYYDAVNEKGLAMAGLNFVGNAQYRPVLPGKENLTQFEFIPFILGRCASIKEVREVLRHINLTDIPFRKELPPSPLHWIIADREEAITVESVKEGLMVYDNPVGVLTNNPPFDQQLLRLTDYLHLSPRDPENHFSADLSLKLYSRGMGAMGLPGDLSSPSRFVRAAFTKMNAVSDDSETASVSQFFHILGAVDQQRGCCQLHNGEYEITIYTSCCNCSKGIYYYTSYDNHQITAVDMHRCDLDGNQLFRYPMILEQQIRMQN